MKKQISMFADESEIKDFELVKRLLNRKTYSDAVRAMISYCKKNLTQEVDIEDRTSCTNNKFKGAKK